MAGLVCGETQSYGANFLNLQLVDANGQPIDARAIESTLSDLVVEMRKLREVLTTPRAFTTESKSKV